MNYLEIGFERGRLHTWVPARESSAYVDDVDSNCRFDDCEWKLEGPAADTLAHLKVMWAQGAKAPVQALIKEITSAG